ncbi:Multidrug resistance protein 1, partial [Quaeritorhiza haematococci]
MVQNTPTSSTSETAEKSVSLSTRFRQWLNNVHTKDGQNEPSTPPKVSVLGLFRFATLFDVGLMLGGSVSGVIAGVAWPLMTVLLGDMIQAFISYQGDRDQLNAQVARSAFYLCLIGIATFGLCWIQTAFWMLAAENQAKRIRLLFLKSVMHQDIAWFDTKGTGDITNRLTADINLIQDGISEKLGLVIQYTSSFIAGFVVAFIKGWKLALVITATIPVVGGSTAMMSILIAKSTSESQDAYASAGAIAQETLSSIRTVTAFNAQEKEASRYAIHLRDAARVGFKKAWYAGLGTGAMMGSLYLCYSISFWYGSILIEQGMMTGGDVVSTFFGVIVGGYTIGQSGPGLTALATARGVASKIFEIIDRKSLIDSSEKGGKKLDHVKGEIVFKDIHFAYPSRPTLPILSSFSLTIPPNTTVALVGASGSGKSTIAKLITRFYDPSKGSITLDGVDLKDVNLKWLRRQVGVVSQEPVLFERTVRENILLGLDEEGEDDEGNKEVGHGSSGGKDLEMERRIEEACRTANAWDFIQKLPRGLDTPVGEAGNLLSGGQKQRIAIARAIIRNPKILLLDEATSALDTESERLVQSALDNASIGRTTIVIAHRLSTIRNADLIVVVAPGWTGASQKDDNDNDEREEGMGGGGGGRIVEMGTHEELMKKMGGVYAELVKAQEMKMEKDDGEDGGERKGGKDIQHGGELKKNVTEETVIEVSNSLIMIEDTEEKLKAPTQSIEAKEGNAKIETPSSSNNLQKGSFSRVFRYNAPEWYLIIIGLLGALLDGAFVAGAQLAFGQVVNVFGKTGDELRRGGNFWSLIFLLLGIGDFLANFAMVTSFTISGEKLTQRLRDLLFRALLRQEIAFFDEPRHATGALAARLAEDAAKVQGMAGRLMGTWAQAAANAIGGIIVAFVFNWELTLVTLGTIPLIALGGALEYQAIQGSGSKTKKAYNKANQGAAEAIQNIRTVVALNKEDRFYEEYRQTIGDGRHDRTFLKTCLVSGVGFGFSQGIQFLAFALAFWYGGRLIVQDRADGLAVITVIFSVIFASMFAGYAAAFAPSMARAQIAATSIFEILDRTPRIDHTSEKGVRSSPAEKESRGKAEILDARFSYPTRPNIPILRGLNIRAQPGEMIALCGPSGCGKSTVISLLERFYDLEPLPHGYGTVVFNDTNVQDWHLPTLRNRISLVGQEPILFNTTIRENIAYGAAGEEVKDEEIEEAARMAN